MLNLLKNQKGFSIMELLSSVSIVGLILVLISSGFKGDIENARAEQIKNDIHVYEIYMMDEYSFSNRFLNEWPTSYAHPKTLKSTGRVYNRNGLVEDSYDFSDKYIFIPVGLIETKLTGSFFVSSDGQRVYYYEENVEDEDYAQLVEKESNFEYFQKVKGGNE